MQKSADFVPLFSAFWGPTFPTVSADVVCACLLEWVNAPHQIINLLRTNEGSLDGWMTRLEKLHNTTTDLGLGCVTFDRFVPHWMVRAVSKWAVAAGRVLETRDIVVVVDGDG